MIKRVAITGISGYLGYHLARELERDPQIELVLGLDLKPPPASLPRLTFLRHDITEPFADHFLEHWIDTAVHLAFYAPSRDRAREQRVNLLGTDRFLEASHRAGVLQLLVASCASAYGTSPGRQPPLEEDAPLRGDETGYGYAIDKVAQEERCMAFEAEHPEVRIIRVRPAPLMGPGASHFIADALRRVPLFLPRRMSALQVCHVEDVARALALLLKAGARGAFNIAPGDAVEAEDLGRILAHRRIPIPRRAARALTRLGWERGWHRIAGAPPEALAYLETPSRISSRRLELELDFRYHYSSRQALEHFARAGAAGHG